MMIIHTVKMKNIFLRKRLDSSYFLNDDALNSSILEDNQSKCFVLGDIAKVFNPPIFKRQFCQKTPNAVPYCQSSDVVNALDGSAVYINRVQAEKINAIVKKNQILVTGFGSIGNVRLVNELSEGIAYANNVCRIEIENKWGFYYAFMASKYGKSQLNKNASGSVVRYIEAPGIKRTLIPMLPDTKQEEIHQLIVEAAELRVEANRAHTNAIALFENVIGHSKASQNYQYGSIHISNVQDFLTRFDGQYQLIKSSLRNEAISMLEYKKIGGFAKDIYVGNRGKRLYVPSGIPFLSSSDMMLANPKRFCKQISSKTPGLSASIVKKNYILISRSGTVGNTVIVNDDLDKTAVSEHALKLVINEDKISPQYVYCYLQTKHGQMSMASASFGSVIITLNEDMIADIDIPIVSKEIQNQITAKIEKYQALQAQSVQNENRAIKLIEDEIDQWQ